MDALRQSLSGTPENFVYPFYWQQGVNQEILMEELERIRESGARAICIEARPHPDFAGPGWWSDIDRIMHYAEVHEMKVWLLDDDHFPTGHANGAFADGMNPLANRFLTMHAADINGPVSGGYMPVTTYLREDAAVLCVAACRRCSAHDTSVVPESFLDLTGLLKDGWIKVDLPDGFWRIMTFYSTCHGNGKLDYFNILDSRSVKLLLDRVYEPHYEKYSRYFGNVFQGFFSDEPEFGNLPGYEFRSRLGRNMPFIPWSCELEVRLKKRWGEKFSAYLPALWLSYGADTDAIRYMYMDETTKQLAVSFSGQISRWCQERGVIHVGHIIEDDNAHGRLACSTGHYFRSLSGMGMAGVDVVHLEILPGMLQEVRQWMASDRDGEFFHFGLAKLGSSLAHIDRKKHGNTMCELFGAYGWQEGIGLMRWLTDHMLSRGVNYFVPHAYSPKSYPDPDCPPHFYANGHHPQFAFFGELTRYMNRVSNLFTEGSYPAEAAVLYHADSEWAGETCLYQKPLRRLMEHQIEADILPPDVFECFRRYRTTEDKSGIPSYDVSFDGALHVADQTYHVLIIPGCQYLPQAVADFIEQALPGGFPVCFTGRRPQGVCGFIGTAEEKAKQKALFASVPLILNAELPAFCRQYFNPLFTLRSTWTGLRTWPYQKDGRCYLFLFNENTLNIIKDIAVIRTDASAAWWYDAARNQLYEAEYQCYTDDGRMEIAIGLQPSESRILVLGEAPEGVEIHRKPQVLEERVLDGGWRILAKEVLTGKIVIESQKVPGAMMPDLSECILHKRFCGTLIYQTELLLSDTEDTPVVFQIREEQDCVRVLIDEQEAALLFGNPLEAELLIPAGTHMLTLELPLTPAWENGDIWNGLTVIPGAGLKKLPFCLICASDRKKSTVCMTSDF